MSRLAPPYRRPPLQRRAISSAYGGSLLLRTQASAADWSHPSRMVWSWVEMRRAVWSTPHSERSSWGGNREPHDVDIEGFPRTCGRGSACRLRGAGRPLRGSGRAFTAFRPKLPNHPWRAQPDGFAWCSFQGRGRQPRAKGLAAVASGRRSVQPASQSLSGRALPRLVSRSRNSLGGVRQGKADFSIVL